MFLLSRAHISLKVSPAFLQDLVVWSVQLESVPMLISFMLQNCLGNPLTGVFDGKKTHAANSTEDQGSKFAIRLVNFIHIYKMLDHARGQTVEG